MRMHNTSLISLLAFVTLAASAAERPSAEFAPLDIRRVEQVYLDDVLRETRRSYALRYRSDMDGSQHVVEVAVEGKTDSRSSIHPKIAGRLWRWPLLAGVAVVAFLIARTLAGGHSPGTLRVLQGPVAERRFALRRGRTRIGSLVDNDVVIDSEIVSRHHAEIRAGRKKIEIEDLRSMNGTMLNGVPIQVSPLQSGDRIRIGDVEMVFER